MIHLVYSVHSLLLSEYFSNQHDKRAATHDVIFMMNSYSCPEEIALKVKAVYTLKHREELEDKLFELLTDDKTTLRSWY